VTDLIANNNPNKIKAVWRSVKDMYIDKNGFVPLDDLVTCFYEQFPAAMEGKSAVYFFRKFASKQDKNLINYRQCRTAI
jgi:hypothetical protein